MLKCRSKKKPKIKIEFEGSATICPLCGFSLKFDFKYCPGCGEKIEWYVRSKKGETNGR